MGWRLTTQDQLVLEEYELEIAYQAGQTAPNPLFDAGQCLELLVHAQTPCAEKEGTVRPSSTARISPLRQIPMPLGTHHRSIRPEPCRHRRTARCRWTSSNRLCHQLLQFAIEHGGDVRYLRVAEL